MGVGERIRLGWRLGLKGKCRVNGNITVIKEEK